MTGLLPRECNDTNIRTLIVTICCRYCGDIQNGLITEEGVKSKTCSKILHNRVIQYVITENSNVWLALVDSSPAMLK